MEILVQDPWLDQFCPADTLPTITLSDKMVFFHGAAEKAYQEANEKWKKLSRNDPDEWPLCEYSYCLESYLVEGSKETYESAARFAKEFGFDTVADIGCACGVQGDLFHQVGVGYLGIEVCTTMLWPEQEGLKFLHAKYPCPLPKLAGKVLGVSNLCVGYQCTDYLEISEQFDDFLLCSCRDGYDGLGAFYESATRIIDPAGRHDDRWVWYHGSKRKGKEG